MAGREPVERRCGARGDLNLLNGNSHLDARLQMPATKATQIASMFA